MEQAFTRVLVAVAMIALASYVATCAGYAFSGSRDAGVGDLYGKGLEMGQVIYDSPTVVYSFSTGGRAMTVVSLGAACITIDVVGDSISWSFPKNAAVVRGISFASPPSPAFSVSSSDLIAAYSLGGSFYLEPKVLFRYGGPAPEGGRTVHRISVVSCYLSNFTASGTFDLVKEEVLAAINTYERQCLYRGSVSVAIDGSPVITFTVLEGESVVVESVHLNVRLVPVVRG